LVATTSTALGEVRTERSDDAALDRIALAFAATLDLPELLDRIVDASLEACDAKRASLLLLSGDHLVPTMAVGVQHNEEEFQTFRAMPPIRIGPMERAVLDYGRAVGIPDARGSELVPPLWTEMFDLRRIGIVPLMSSGDPEGLMVVDWPDVGEFTDIELRRLETVAAYAGLAVRNARLYERERRSAALQAALAKAAGELGGHLEPRLIARRLVPAYVDLLQARVCVIALFDAARQQFATVASKGVRNFPEPVPLAALPVHIVERFTAEWDRQKPTVWMHDETLALFLGTEDARVSSFLILPLVVEGSARGVVLLGFDDGTALDAGECEAAEALAALAAAALEREELVDRLNRQVHQLDALHRLSGALTGRADRVSLVTALNQLLDAQDVEVVDVVCTDRRLARYLATDDGEGEKHATTTCTSAIPMRLGGRRVGELRLRARPAPEATNTAEAFEPSVRAFLESLANGLAEIINRGALRSQVENVARERAVAAERDRMANDLHDTAGQMFVAIGLLARREVESHGRETPWADRARRLAELADRGKWETDQAVRALAFLPAERRGLVPALRALGRSFASDSGIDVVVNVEGKVRRLPPRIERALYRVANEAFTNAWRHARCLIIRAQLTFTDDEVEMVIFDDGIGLDMRHPQTGIHMGMASMRRSMSDVGGSLRVRPAKPRGLQMEVKVRTDRR
jgi:signal transduction histidine kinase